MTTTHTETRTTRQQDGSTREEEVVVGVSVKELTLEDVEEAIMAFEEEVMLPCAALLHFAV